MQPTTVRPIELTRNRVLTSTLTFLIALLALFAARWLSAQTPTAPSPRKPEPTVAPAAGTLEGEVTHVVKKGDTLWDIAKAYLKDPFRWPEVFQRNTDVVENPHWIY